MHEAVEHLRAAILRAGLQPPERIVPDGKVHRFSTSEELGDDAGWYVMHAGVIPTGYFGDWRTGLSEAWSLDVGRPLTAAEKAAHSMRLHEIREIREAEQRRRQAIARKEAQTVWNAATPAGNDHPYLARKQVQAYGLRLHSDGRLIAPVHAEGQLYSLQFIDADGAKLFLAGGRVKGGYHVIGNLAGATPICICEGYATGATIHLATGYAVVVAFNAANLVFVARAVRIRLPEARLVLCADDDYATPGNAGLTKATDAADAVGGVLAVPNFGVERPASATDFNDLMVHSGLGAVAEAIMNAQPTANTASRPSLSRLLTGSGLSALPESPQPAAIEAALRTLAELLSDADPLRRTVVCAAAIDVLKEKKVTRPAALVDVALGSVGLVDATTGQGTALALSDPEPWPHPVDIDELLGEIRDTFSRYVVLLDHSAVALALWVLHTHTIDAAYISPILAIISPQKRCGKTTVLELLACLVRRPLSASNITAAALFRAIEGLGPTLLIDEAETFLPEHEELRGVLNSGHARSSAQVVRTVGDDYEPRVFRTFGPKAIAAIGSLPGTIEDRALIVRMQRRAAHEHVEGIRRDRIGNQLLPLRRRAARWASDHVEVLKAADPPMPPSLHDRAADNWRPMLALADVAGGQWPALGRAAALALSLTNDAADSEAGVMLLVDLKDLFDSQGVERLASAKVINHLVTLETRPWPEWKRGNPLTPRGLARLLKPFGILPKSIRLGTDTPKGYELRDFEDAFARYLPTRIATAPHPASDIEKMQLSDPPQPSPCGGVTTRTSAYGAKDSGAVADMPDVEVVELPL